MPSKLKILADMKLLVARMEEDQGLSDYSNLNRALITAVVDLHAQGDCNASTAAILEHQLLKEFSRPSVFRALRMMEASGEIKKVGTVRGYYAPTH